MIINRLAHVSVLLAVSVPARNRSSITVTSWSSLKT